MARPIAPSGSPPRANPVDRMLGKGLQFLQDAPTTKERMVVAHRGAQLIFDHWVTKAGLGAVAFGSNPERKQALADLRSVVAEAVATEGGAVDAMQAYTQGIDTLLQAMSEEALAEVGDAPTPFAVMALGSYGRQELSPYSDLDYGIVLDPADPAAVKWGRKFAEALSRRIKQLGETTIFGLRGTRSCTTFSPVGFKALQLVGSIESYKKQFASDAPSDQAMRDVLLNPRPVFGDAEVIKGLTSTLVEHLDAAPAQSPGSRQAVLQKVLDYLPTRRNPSGELAKDGVLDVKDELFRAFVYPGIMMAVAWDLESTSSIGRLKEAEEKGLVDPRLARAVEAAMEAAIQLRLHSHSEQGREQDHIPLTPEAASKLMRHHRVLTRYAQLAEKLADLPEQSPFISKGPKS